MTSLILLLSSFSTDEARESSGDPEEEASLSIKCSNDEWLSSPRCPFRIRRSSSWWSTLTNYTSYKNITLTIYEFSFSLITFRCRNNEINSDLVFSDLKFRALYSEIATVKVVISSGLSLDLSKNCFYRPPGRYTKQNPLNLATSIGFNDLEPCDGGWSQNPM